MEEHTIKNDTYPTYLGMSMRLDDLGYNVLDLRREGKDGEYEVLYTAVKENTSETCHAEVLLFKKDKNYTTTFKRYREDEIPPYFSCPATILKKLPPLNEEHIGANCFFNSALWRLKNAKVCYKENTPELEDAYTEYRKAVKLKYREGDLFCLYTEKGKDFFKIDRIEDDYVYATTETGREVRFDIFSDEIQGGLHTAYEHDRNEYRQKCEGEKFIL